jgi:hypothetical protein
MVFKVNNSPFDAISTQEITFIGFMKVHVSLWVYLGNKRVTKSPKKGRFKPKQIESGFQQTLCLLMLCGVCLSRGTLTKILYSKLKQSYPFLLKKSQYKVILIQLIQRLLSCLLLQLTHIYCVAYQYFLKNLVSY